MKKTLSRWLLGNVAQKYTTNAPYNAIIEELTNTVKSNSFSVLVTHNLRETYVKKNLDIPDDFEYRIVQICNAPKSHKALNELSFDMGIMMPKSIIVARENGLTTLRFMKMKPWMVSFMFPELDIVPMSKKVSVIMEKIVTETIEKAEMNIKTYS
ncbi:MAG: hypothetical protein DRJ09_03320 [Bacteroidetes bacterium]|nr:MAG: hypothetical protein DRJ09_03320 [Bacteroidota bacterium]